MHPTWAALVLAPLAAPSRRRRRRYRLHQLSAGRRRARSACAGRRPCDSDRRRPSVERGCGGEPFQDAGECAWVLRLSFTSRRISP
eukprot:scaffold241_cov229-Prasinococcus_capsulatus_cf.AAC.6